MREKSDTRTNGLAVAMIGLMDAAEHDGNDLDEVMFLAKTWREQEAEKRAFDLSPEMVQARNDQLNAQLAASDSARLAALSIAEDARNGQEIVAAQLDGANELIRTYRESQNQMLECYHDRLAEKEVLKSQLADANRRLEVATKALWSIHHQSAYENNDAIVALREMGGVS